MKDESRQVWNILEKVENTGKHGATSRQRGFEAPPCDFRRAREPPIRQRNDLGDASVLSIAKMK